MMLSKYKNQKLNVFKWIETNYIHFFKREKEAYVLYSKCIKIFAFKWQKHNLLKSMHENERSRIGVVIVSFVVWIFVIALK